MPSDLLTEARVRRELESAEGVDAMNVTVNVIDGLATLRGCPHSHSERLAVRMATAGTAGVTAVRDEMEWRPRAHDWHLTDRAIEADARHRLAKAALTEFDVAVEFRRARLHGKTESESRPLLARHVIATTPGVHFFVDHSEVGTKDPGCARPSSERVGS